MAEQHIYVLQLNGIWGISSWADGSNITRSLIQSKEETIKQAEVIAFEVQGKGHDYIIYIQQNDGTFAIHRRYISQHNNLNQQASAVEPFIIPED